MDRKSLLIVVVSLVLLFGAWSLVDHLYPPVPRPKLPPQVQQTNAISTPAETAATLGNIPTPVSPVSSIISTAGPEQTLIVTNDHQLLHFTSRGGGLKWIEMKGYPAIILPGKQSTNLAVLGMGAQVPTLAVFGGDQITGDNNFTLSRTGNVVRAEKTLTNGLRVIKEFQIGTNYLLNAKLRFENTSSKSIGLPVQNVIIGTATPMNHVEDSTMVGTLWYNGSKMESIGIPWFVNSSFGGCGRSNPRSLYQGGAGNVQWAAVHNQFFTLAAMPSTNAPQISVISVPLTPMPFLPKLITNGLQAAFTYPPAVVEPGKVLERDYEFYAGPKEYNRLAQIGTKMGNNLDLIMNFGFFGFFSKILLLSMNAVHMTGLSYALCIIVITIIIKLVFWPLTNASTKSMKRMQEFQPQMKAIAEKYKDDPNKKNQKTMEFMKEHKINPLGGCLPMLLQIPVLFGFYMMIRSAIELRGATFLWAFDLSQPDTVAIIGGIPLNILPILMALTMIWQTGLTPTSPGMDATQQKIMRWGMPVMMLFFLYRISSGLTLYWTVQNLLTIAQTKITKTNDTSTPGQKVTPVVLAKKKK